MNTLLIIGMLVIVVVAFSFAIILLVSSPKHPKNLDNGQIEETIQTSSATTSKSVTPIQTQTASITTSTPQTTTVTTTPLTITTTTTNPFQTITNTGTQLPPPPPA